MIIKEGTIYFALKEIAPRSPYSADYLRIRILQKKLKGVKVGREWYTSREWLDEYLSRYALKQLVREQAPVAEIMPEPPEEMPTATAIPAIEFTPAITGGSPASFISAVSEGNASPVAADTAAVPEPQPLPFSKEEILRRHDFREFVGKLRTPVPKIFFAAPLVAGLAFAVVSVTGASIVPRVSALAQEFQTAVDDLGTLLLSAGMPELPDFRKAVAIAAEWPHVVGRGILDPLGDFTETTFRRLGDFALEASIPAPSDLRSEIAAFTNLPKRFALSPATIADSLRNFFSGLPRPKLSARLAALFNLTSPDLTPPQANAPVRLALEPKGQQPASGGQEPPAPPIRIAQGVPPPATPVREIVERTEIVRPADVSLFQARLDELNAGMRTQVSKLITDVASLYEISDRKVTITQAFAPSQSINELQELKVDSGLTVRSGDVTLSTGSLTLSGSSASLTTGGGLTVSGNAAITGTLSSGPFTVSGSGTSTIASGLTIGTSGGSIGLGTTSPSQFFAVSGNTYLTGGLGIGTVTTSPGGIQATGMAVIGSTLDVRGTGTSTFAGPVSIAGALSVNSGVLTISSTSTVTTQFSVTKSPSTPHTFGTWSTGVSNSAVSDAALFINPASASADTNLFGIAIDGSPRFLVDAEGDLYGRNLILEGQTTQASTLVNGALTVEGNAALGDAANADTHIIRGATNLYASTSQPALDIWNSSNGAVLSLRTGTGQTPTTSFTFTTGGNLGIGSTTPTVGLSVATSTYITLGLGIGEATTSPGGLLVKGLGVFDQTLLVRGTGTSTYSGGISAAGLALTNGLTITSGSLDVSAVGLKAGNASTTNLSASNLLTVAGTGTSTFTGGISSAGLRSTSGIESTAGDFLLTGGKIIATGTGTSTFSGGGSFAGLASSGGLRVSSGDTVFAGGLAVTGSSNFTGSVGIGTSTPSHLLTLRGPFLAQATSTILGGGLNLEALQATGTLAFYTSGTAAPRMVVDSGGNVGIATSGPTTTFSTVGSGYFTAGLGAGYATTGSGNIVANDFILSRGRLGVNATGSPTVEFGVIGSGYLTGGLGIGEATTSPGGLLVKGLGVFAQTLLVRGTGTSTFSGGGSFAGLSSSAGITSSAGDLILTGGKIVSTGAGTSTFSGGLAGTYLNLTGADTATSTASNGFNLAGGCFAVAGVCIGGAASGWTPSGSNVVLTNSGDFVGIGTSTPGVKFAVTGAGLIQDAFTVGGILKATSTTLLATAGGSVGVGTTSPWGLFSVESVAGIVDNRTPIFVIGDQGSTSPAFIVTASSTGPFVGIGTKAPLAPLHLDKDSTAEENVLAIFGNSNSTINRNLFIETIGSNANPSLQAATNGKAATLNLLLNYKGGNVGIGTTSPAALFSVAADGNGDSAYFVGDVGIGRPAAAADLEVYSPAGGGNPTIQITAADSNPIIDLFAELTSAASGIIRFRDGNTNPVGEIRGNNADNTIEFFDSAVGTSDLQARIQSDAAGQNDDGWATAAIDYGEYMEKLDVREDIQIYDVVGIKGRKITKDTNGAALVMVTSTHAGLRGGNPLVEGYERHKDPAWLVVAFIGQMPVLVEGSVEEGDYIIPSGNNNGKAKAVSPSKITREQFNQAIGRALESDTDLVYEKGQYKPDSDSEIDRELYKLQQRKGDHRIINVAVGTHMGSPKLDSEISGGDIAGGSAGWTLDPYSGRITTVFDLDLMGKDILNVRSLLSQNGTWRIDENGTLTAKKIETEALTVRNPDAGKTGITISDRVTGASYCAFVANGQWQTEAGECGSTNASTAIAAPPPVEPAPAAIEPASDSEPTGDTSVSISISDTATTAESTDTSLTSVEDAGLASSTEATVGVTTEAVTEAPSGETTIAPSGS